MPVCTSQVHARVLSLAPSARSQFSSGRVFSLVSSDAETLSSLCMSALGLVSSPLRILGERFHDACMHSNSLSWKSALS